MAPYRVFLFKSCSSLLPESMGPKSWSAFCLSSRSFLPDLPENLESTSRKKSLCLGS